MGVTVLIVGDSLACPRPWEGVDLGSTYGYLIGTRLPAGYVANHGASDNSSARAIKEGFLRTHLRAAGADFAIVQLGIVDCAPRLLGGFERLVGFAANRVRPLRGPFNAYVKFKSRHRLRLTRWFPKTLVPIDAFAVNYRTLIEEVLSSNPVRKIFLINIAYPGAIMTERSYNILGNVTAYNAEIAKLAAAYPGKVEIVDLFKATEARRDWITVADGHHITAEAHAWLADTISGTISRCTIEAGSAVHPPL